MEFLIGVSIIFVLVCLIGIGLVWWDKSKEADKQAELQRQYTERVEAERLKAARVRAAQIVSRSEAKPARPVSAPVGKARAATKPVASPSRRDRDDDYTPYHAPIYVDETPSYAYTSRQDSYEDRSYSSSSSDSYSSSSDSGSSSSSYD